MAKRYDLETIKSSVNIVELISRYVRLNRRGNRLTGLCPFHNEKTPSFSVDEDKKYWHCFGCGKGGNAITFAMEINNFEFPDAIEFLAEMYSIPPLLDGAKPDTTYTAKRSEKELMYQANQKAVEAYRKALRGRAGSSAMMYLKNRGITDEDITRFSLGYSPTMWDALANNLSKDFPVDILIKAGLVTKRQNGSGVFDRFRNRLIIPIFDRDGKAIGFGGRALLSEDNPKYLNTAETPVFHKSSTLYAFNLAQKSIKEKKRAIVTEGYFDVIACHKAGFTETVATLGTAMTEEHVKILRRLVDIVYLIYDGDSAGINAALRAQAIFRDCDLVAKIVVLPSADDPDTFIRNNGNDAFENMLETALSPVEFELDVLIKQIAHGDADGLIRLQRGAAKILAQLPLIDRATYAHVFAGKVAEKAHDIARIEQAILAEIGGIWRGNSNNNPKVVANIQGKIADNPLEREALAYACSELKYAKSLVENILPDTFTHPTYKNLFLKVISCYAEGKTVEEKSFSENTPQLSNVLAAINLRTPGLIEENFEKVLQRIISGQESERIDKSKVALLDEEEMLKVMELNKKRSKETEKHVFGIRRDENEKIEDEK